MKRRQATSDIFGPTDHAGCTSQMRINVKCNNDKTIKNLKRGTAPKFVNSVVDGPSRPPIRSPLPSLLDLVAFVLDATFRGLLDGYLRVNFRLRGRLPPPRISVSPLKHRY